MENMPEKDNLEDILSDLRHEQLERREFAMKRLEIYSFRFGHEKEPDSLEAAFRVRTRLLQDSRIVEALLIAIGDQSTRIRAGAAILLGHSELPEVQKPLIRLLRNDPVSKVRMACNLGLQSTPNSPEKTVGYISALYDPHDTLVSSSCYVLWQIGDKQAIEPLRTVLTHSCWDVRFGACEALVRLNAIDLQVVNILEELNQQPEAEHHNQWMLTIDSQTTQYDPQSRTTQAVLERARRALQ
jgi:HEAT repeat protein